MSKRFLYFILIISFLIHTVAAFELIGFQPWFAPPLLKFVSLLGIKNPFYQATLLSMVTMIWSFLLTTYFIFTAIKRTLSIQAKKLSLLILSLLCFLPNVHVRYAGENWGALFIVSAIVFYVHVKDNMKRYYFAVIGVLLAFALASYLSSYHTFSKLDDVRFLSWRDLCMVYPFYYLAPFLMVLLIKEYTNPKLKKVITTLIIINVPLLLFASTINNTSNVPALRAIYNYKCTNLFFKAGKNPFIYEDLLYDFYRHENLDRIEELTPTMKIPKGSCVYIESKGFLPQDHEAIYHSVPRFFEKILSEKIMYKLTVKQVLISR